MPSMSRRSSSLPLLLGLALCTIGCGTVHPRYQRDLPERTADIDNLAFVFPQIRVAIRYTGTDVLVLSPRISRRSADVFVDRASSLLDEAGYFVTVFLPSDSVDFPSYRAETLWMHTGLEFPEGVPSTSRPIKQNERSFQVSVAEELIARMMARDPDYLEPYLPEDLLFPGLLEGYQGYDIVFVVFGVTRAETETESWWRWLKNVTLNLAMIPVAAAGFLIPVALPLSISLSFFFEPTPDRAFYGVVGFDPSTGRVEYMNDFYARGSASEDAVSYAAERLFEDFPPKPEEPEE